MSLPYHTGLAGRHSWIVSIDHGPREGRLLRIRVGTLSPSLVEMPATPLDHWDWHAKATGNVPILAWMGCHDYLMMQRSRRCNELPIILASR